MAFFSNFSNAFDRLPHLELLKKGNQFGVGGCLIEVPVDHLSIRMQFVRVDNVRSVE